MAFLKPFRFAVGGILLMTLVLAGVNAVEPLILKRVFDSLGNGKNTSTLVRFIVLLVGLGLFRELSTGMSNWLTWRTRLGVHFSLMEATVGRLHRLPLSFHRNEGVGALMTKLDRGIQGFVGAVNEVAFNVLPAVLYLVLSIVLMVKLDWRLALLVIAFAPLPGIIAAFAAPSQTRRERTLLDRWVAIYARFNEVLSGILTVKCFAMEDREKQRFLHDVENANGVVTRGVATDSAVSGVQNLVVAAARISAIGLGGLLVLRGQVTVGTVVAFLGYVGGLFGPVQGLSSIYKTLQTASVSLEQVFSILDAHDTLGDAPDALEITSLDGEVLFDNVSFSYPDSKQPLIRGVTLHVRPGENIALVGPSGAGKSTLMALLCRFYDPKSGSIRVDGRDLRALKQTSLRRQIGVVLQDSLLFNESVRNNIAYGRPNASQAEIEAAARAANAHDFISRLPQGYDTLVGERGSRLSTGERRRISIVRSILKNPPILVLDEPTSALDAESEALVQDALSQLMKGRTTFAIAHRLSTVVDADRILVLKDGRIIEEGSHAELMALNGYYASLVLRQTRGLLPTATAHAA